MPITIRELIASDTISQAVDKINFNFDQLLLNGGGPRGPVGPAGPIGPIGGRGIRGSVWYEGLNSPLTTPPTLTPEDQDNYLQANGDVWTYSESGGTWVLTGVNLIGPVGPAGASGKFSDYQNLPYTIAGDTTIYPNLMTPPPGGTSGNTSNRFIKAVVIGGLPGNLPGVTNPNPVPGLEVIASSLAQQIVQPAVSLFVHQFNSGSSAIKFHGGDQLADFSNIITDLSEIRLANDDCLVISAPKVATSYTSVSVADGLRVLTQHRNQLFQAGKRITFQTGASSLGGGPGDTNDFIVEADRNGSGSVPTIQLNVLAGDTAELRLGGISSPGIAKTGVFWANAGAITLQGSTSITATSPLITLSGTQQTNIYAGNTTLPVGAAGRVTIGASSQIVMRTVNGASTGAISIGTGDSTSGSISLTTGTTSSGNIAISTSAGTGMVNITSSNTSLSPNGAINIRTTGATAGHIWIRTAASSPGSIYMLVDGTGDANIQTSGGNINLDSTAGAGRVNITSGASNSGSLGAINISTSGASAGNINLLTAPSSSGNIVLSTGTSSTGNIIISTTAGNTGDVIILADTSVIISHGVSDSVTVQPIGGDSVARINVKPLGTAVQSIINVFGDAAATKNLLIKSDSSANVGSITVSANMDLSLINDGTGSDRIRVVAGNTAPTGNSDPRFAVNAANHYTHGSQITHNADSNILSSGRFTVGVTGASGTILWHRVGNVVTGSGKLTATGTTASPILIPYPIKGAGNVVYASGIGTVNTAIIREVEAAATTFSIPGSALTASQEFIFTFSYVIA